MTRLVQYLVLAAIHCMFFNYCSELDSLLVILSLVDLYCCQSVFMHLSVVLGNKSEQVSLFCTYTIYQYELYIDVQDYMQTLDSSLITRKPWRGITRTYWLVRRAFFAYVIT